MKKNNAKKFYFLIGIILEGLFLLLPLEELQAQEKSSSSAPMEEQAETLPAKSVSLELIPLEGKNVNLEKCYQMDSRSLCLQQNEALLVHLKKPSYFNFGNNSKNDVIEARMIVDHQEDSFFGLGLFGWWLNWMEVPPPLRLIGITFGATNNVYHYQATQTLGDVRLSFISHTVPRYYAGLHLHVEKRME